MSAREVTATLKMALNTADLTKYTARDSSVIMVPVYLSRITRLVGTHGLTSIWGKPYHPMTQVKIERWHCSPKNRIMLEPYYLPGELEREIAEFVTHDNQKRYHESLQNPTPEDMWLGGGQDYSRWPENTQREHIETPKAIAP